MYLKSYLPAVLLFMCCVACKPGSLLSNKYSKDPAKCPAVLVRIKNSGPKPVYKYIINVGKRYYEFNGLQPNDSTEYQCMHSVERKFNLPIIVMLSANDTARFEKDITDDFSTTHYNIVEHGKVTVFVNVDYKKNGDKYSQATMKADTKVEE